MDERRLTAWLITHNMLPSDQIKETLEEQIRLQRSGEQLDVIAVARRKGFLTDAQVIDILEKTGYRPVQAKAPAVLASMSGITVMPRQETEEVSSAEPVAEPAPTTSAGAEGPPPAKLGSGARRRGAVRAPRRRGGDQSTLIALAFGLPIACVLLLLMVSGGGGGSTTEVADDDTPPPTAPSVTSDQFSALLDDFRQSVSRAEKVGADSEEMQRLAGLSAKLRDMASGVGQAKALERVSRRLDALLEAGGGSGVGDWSDREEARVSEAREDRAWAELTRGFERILRLCLTQPQSSVQLGAEAERGIDLRQTLADELAARVDQGAEAVLQLAASQTLYPIVGSAGYSALLREVEYFPQSLRGSERWTQWSAVIPQFEALQAKAEAYDMAMSRAERAAQRGDHAAALRVFSGDHSDDAWFAAAKSYLERPEVAQAFQRRAEQIARGEVVRDNMPVSDRDRGGEDGDATATRGDGRDWKERYLALDHTYRRGSDSEKQGAVSLLEQLLRETLQLAQGSFEDCAEIVAVFDEHDRCFRDEINLQNLRRQHHELYFNGAFARASGPHTFRSLDAWCEERGYEAWRAQLRPYLRLVAEANSRQARQREQVRRQRQEARAAVGRFAEQRLETVTEGFEDLLEWMGRQGFAPEDVKAELDETLARALERAGSPVSGGRLRRELRSLEHTATEEDTQRLRRDYERQVELVVDAVVRESLEAVEKCLAAGEPGLAFDLFGYVLLLDPNNERAHRGLGHVEVEGRWVRRFEAEKLRDGYAWDDRFGWMKFAEEARYEAGEFYDVQEGRWTSLAEANQTHSQWANPWVIRTEHFELRSSADIGKSAQIAKRLEAFYLQIFRQYDLFFMARGGAALIFGVAPSQNDPLVVNFYRDEQQFRAHANPPTGWAAGFYSGGQHASFFYDMGNAYSSVTVLQHEITHQILGETSPGGAESWLAEGAAVYLEDAFFRDGQLTLGELKDHSRVRTYKSNIRSGNEHTFESITQLKTGSQWDSGDISANYRGAGAAVYFLCHFDGGRYRGDYVEFLRDQYYRRSPSFEDTFGLSARTLNLLMQRFYDPEAQLDMGGSGEFSLETLEAAQEAFEATCDARDPDIDQISQAYAMLREALQNAPERESDRARNGAGRDLVSLRRKQAKIVEKATRDEGASGSERQQQYMELQRLRQEALAIINDTARYPDENHGAAGQHLVDEKVDALRAFWEREPEALQDPEVNRALEILEATDPWLVELEVRERNRGESAEELRRQLVRAASPAGLALTQDDLQAQEYDAKVRAYNASRTDLPEDCRDQVRILNDYREMLGLHALALDARLYQSSLKHSQWMEQTGNFSHQENTPGRVQPMDRARQEGYEGGVGENIAFGYPTAPAVHMGWYNSSGHHRNMTGRNWYQIGVGRAGTYWTQNFGTGKPDLP